MKSLVVFSVFVVLIQNLPSGLSVENTKVIENCKTRSGDEQFFQHLWVKEYDFFQCLGNDFKVNLGGYNAPFYNEFGPALHEYSRSKNQTLFDSYLPRYCPGLKNAVEKCLPEYFNAYSPCFEDGDEEGQILQQSPERFQRLYKFVCESYNGHSINDFLDNNFGDCMNSNNRAFAKCPDEMKTASVPLRAPSFKATQDMDDDWKRMFSCFTNIIETCDKTDDQILNKAARTLFNDVLDTNLALQSMQFRTYEPGVPDGMQLEHEIEYITKFYGEITKLHENDPKRRDMIEQMETKLQWKKNFFREQQEYERTSTSRY